MKPVTLENLLEKAAIDPSCRPDFYDALIQSNIIVLCQPDVNEGITNGIKRLKKDTTINIKEFQRNNGQHIIPLFTSIDAFKNEITSDETYIEIDARTLFEITKGSSYILNPYSSYSKEFTPEEVNNILTGSVCDEIKYKIDSGTNVLVSQPEYYPRELVSSLIKYFEKTNNIQSAYLVQVFIPKQDKAPHLMVGICMKNHDESIIRNSIIVAQTFLKHDDFIDFMIIKEKDSLIKGIKPFFKNSLTNQVKNIFTRFLANASRIK